MMIKPTTMTAIGLLCCVIANKASAFDIEIDPSAYVLGGHSLHLGFGNGHYRVDIGTFGLKVPQALHGDDNYDVEFSGLGVKLDYLFGHYAGWFVGLEAASSDMTYTRTTSNETTLRRQISLGPRFGYRIMYSRNITITPWLGVAFNLEHEDVILDGERFESEAVSFFPAVHLGWRF